MYVCMYVCAYVCMYMYVREIRMLKSKQRISEVLFLTGHEKVRKSVRDLFVSYLCRVNKTVRYSNAVN